MVQPFVTISVLLIIKKLQCFDSLKCLYYLRLHPCSLHCTMEVLTQEGTTIYYPLHWIGKNKCSWKIVRQWKKQVRYFRIKLNGYYWNTLYCLYFWFLISPLIPRQNLYIAVIFLMALVLTRHMPDIKNAWMLTYGGKNNGTV